MSSLATGIRNGKEINKPWLLTPTSGKIREVQQRIYRGPCEFLWTFSSLKDHDSQRGTMTENVLFNKSSYLSSSILNVPQSSESEQQQLSPKEGDG